mmetsp:Transcript_103269/g.301254  ORF Transcript_103269/g.301254 Transcript_103269/m.301254 type:complete len:219 (-) Transcript_103269:82-738(-)
MWSSMGASRDSRAPRLSSVARRTFHCWCRRLASREATRPPPARLTRSAPRCAATFLVISQHSFFASGQVSVRALASASTISPAKGSSRGPQRSKSRLSSCRATTRSSSLGSGKGSVLKRPRRAERRRGSRLSSSAAGRGSIRRRVIAKETSRHFSVWSPNMRKSGLWSSSSSSRCTNSGATLPPGARTLSSLMMAPRRVLRSASLRQLMSRRTVRRNS